MLGGCDAKGYLGKGIVVIFVKRFHDVKSHVVVRHPDHSCVVKITGLTSLWSKGERNKNKIRKTFKRHKTKKKKCEEMRSERMYVCLLGSVCLCALSIVLPFSWKSLQTNLDRAHYWNPSNHRWRKGHRAVDHNESWRVKDGWNGVEMKEDESCNEF